MIFILSNPYDRERFEDVVKSYLDKGVACELKKKNPKRSLPQNSYLHLILGWFASATGYGVEEVKVDFFKREVNKDIFEREAVSKSGTRVTCLRSTSDLDSGEMTLAIERFRNWSSAKCGVYLPSPNEQEFLLYVEKQMESEREYM